MKGTSAFVALFLSFVFIITSFGASPETMLIGKWKYFKGKKIEFVKDGTLIIGDQGAKYRVIDRERIEFDLGMVAIFSDLGGPRPVFRFTVSNDELTLIPIANPNEAQKLRRVKVDASGNDADTYSERGMNSLRQGNYQEAIKNYSKAIELDPENAVVCFNRACAYGGLGNYQEAIKNYSKAIELNPKFLSPYTGRAMAYSNLGKHGEAIKDCNKAIELDAKYAPAYSYRGYVYSRFGNYQQGIKDIERAIDLDPNDVGSYLTMALIFSIQNNADLACQWLKKAAGKGFKNWEHFKKNRELDNIRNTPCFQEITKSQ